GAGAGAQVGASASSGASASAGVSLGAGASSSASATLFGHFGTCIDKVKQCGVNISAGVKKCGSSPSAGAIVAAVKGELVTLRAAVSAFGQGCLAVKASGKGDLEIKAVASLIVSLLVAVHGAFAAILSVAASVPLVIVFLAGELLAIAAQLVIGINALFWLLGAELKAAVAASLSADVVAGFKTLGCWSLVSVIQI
ncbi:hypothetical protein JCM8097_002386, partial [Rhodosporidiobolus ruineniae]